MSDVIVVGGGLIGMLTARELAAAGAAVTLVERGALGREASWAGGGILSPLYPWRYPDAVNALSRWSQGDFPRLAAELAEETGIDPEWTRSGLLVLEPCDDAVSAWAQRWGGVVEGVAPAALAQLEPGLAAQDSAAQWWPEIAQIRNPRLMRALARRLAGAGVTLRTDEAVTGLVSEAGRVCGVRTGRGRLDADAVVVTAGAWSGELIGPLAAEWGIEPVRGQMLLFQTPPGLVRHIVIRDGHYLVPRRDGRVLAGSTVEYVGFDRATTAEARRELHAAALALVPALGECAVERHWAGLRPGSREGIPLIGAHPERGGLYMNVGHFRNGVVTGPASARLLADILLERAPVIDPTSYAPARQMGI